MPFILQTDTSSWSRSSIRKDGKVVAYASRTLTIAEGSYSVIQQEWLAIIHALKRFRKLTAHFCSCFLAKICKYRWVCHCRNSTLISNTRYVNATNANADALSRCKVGTHQLNITATLLDTREANLQTAQQHDPGIANIWSQLMTSPRLPTGDAWEPQFLKHYKQIWSRLHIPCL